jgi:hypothetical protein
MEAVRMKLGPGLPLVLAVAHACGGAQGAAARPSAGSPVGPGTIIDALAEDGTAVRFRIDSVAADPRDRDGDVSLYGVSVLDGASRRWVPYCNPDADGRSAAIPVQGSWNGRAEPEPPSDRITFACTSGAIGKCIRFGYKPWKSLNGVPLAPYHAACVRMVRADYCGDGRPHTVDGTRIDVWDDLGIQARDEPEGQPEVFEAAWAPDGAAYLNMPRWSDDVGDIVKDCPARLGGRTSRERTLRPAAVRGAFPEALVFNARFVRREDRLQAGH